MKQNTLITLLPVPTGTASATSQTYLVDVRHRLCAGRRVCVNGNVPPVSSVRFTLSGTPTAVGNNTYIVSVIVSGETIYQPYTQGCGCNCSRQDFFNEVFEIPVYSATGVPSVTLTAGDITSTKAIAEEECCNVTGVISVACSLLVSVTPPTA